MWTSQYDLENSERNEHIVFWIMIVGIVIGTYLAIAV
jgi:hypothetical protein